MIFRLLALVALFAAVAFVRPAPAVAQAGSGSNFVISSIEGRVVGPDGKAVERAIVRLLDEGGIRETGRAYTDANGRFKFEITAGNYIVEVEPVGSPGVAKQRQDVLINPGPNSRGGERTFVNFFLKNTAGDIAVSRGPKFEQEVPPEAEREYQNALKVIGTNKDAGYASLRNALQAYPEYYAALEALGTSYIKDDFLNEGVVLLQKAVEVNPKGERSHYGLGVAYYKMKRYDLAVQAFQRADAIVPEDPNTMMYLGLAHVQNKEHAAGEQSLKKAYTLGAKNVPELHMALAKVYIDGKRYKEAAAELRTLLKESPNLKDKDKIQGLIDKYEKM
jgi:tetratricopeptide (TPR) repeat protein